MKLSTHELAKHLLEGPDVPVVVGRDIDIYQAGYTKFHVKEGGKYVLFNTDKKPVNSEEINCFWLSGPFI